MSTRNLVSAYIEDYDKIREVSEELLGKLIGKTQAERAFSQTMNKSEIKEACKQLSDASKWHRMALEYTAVMAPYLKDKLKEMQQMITLIPMIKEFMDKESQARRKVLKGLLEGKGDPDSTKKSGIGKNENVIKYHIDNPVMDNFTEYEVMDEVYKSIAGEIVLRVFES